jgi:hypothetical protein
MLNHSQHQNGYNYLQIISKSQIPKISGQQKDQKNKRYSPQGRALDPAPAAPGYCAYFDKSQYLENK